MPKPLSRKRTSATAITNQESLSSYSVKIPSYNHDQSNLYTFLEELEPYLENIDSNYTMLWQRGAVGMSRTIAAMNPVHARFKASRDRYGERSPRGTWRARDFSNFSASTSEDVNAL